MGTLGYLGLIPGEDLLTLYGRAKALFNDPNVFGPFLILPAMYALQRVLLGTPSARLLGRCDLHGASTVGVFASFSRAAWGHLAVSALMVYLLCFVLVAHAREKVRMLILALLGALMIVVAIGGLLSIPIGAAAVRGARRGAELRRGRDRAASAGRAMRSSWRSTIRWGIGPLEFRNLRIREEPHNTYVNVLHVYGWGGGLAFILLIGTTLWRGVTLRGASPRPTGCC